MCGASFLEQILITVFNTFDRGHFVGILLSRPFCRLHFFVKGHDVGVPFVRFRYVIGHFVRGRYVGEPFVGAVSTGPIFYGAYSTGPYCGIDDAKWLRFLFIESKFRELLAENAIELHVEGGIEGEARKRLWV